MVLICGGLLGLYLWEQAGLNRDALQAAESGGSLPDPVRIYAYF